MCTNTKDMLCINKKVKTQNRVLNKFDIYTLQIIVDSLYDLTLNNIFFFAGNIHILFTTIKIPIVTDGTVVKLCILPRLPL